MRSYTSDTKKPNLRVVTLGNGDQVISQLNPNAQEFIPVQSILTKHSKSSTQQLPIQQCLCVDEIWDAKANVVTVVSVNDEAPTSTSPGERLAATEENSPCVSPVKDNEEKSMSDVSATTLQDKPHSDGSPNSSAITLANSSNSSSIISSPKLLLQSPTTEPLGTSTNADSKTKVFEESLSFYWPPRARMANFDELDEKPTTSKASVDKLQTHLRSISPTMWTQATVGHSQSDIPAKSASDVMKLWPLKSSNLLQQKWSDVGESPLKEPEPNEPPTVSPNPLYKRWSKVSTESIPDNTVNMSALTITDDALAEKLKKLSIEAIKPASNRAAGGVEPNAEAFKRDVINVWPSVSYKKWLDDPDGVGVSQNSGNSSDDSNINVWPLPSFKRPCPRRLAKDHDSYLRHITSESGTIDVFPIATYTKWTDLPEVEMHGAMHDPPNDFSQRVNKDWRYMQLEPKIHKSYGTSTDQRWSDVLMEEKMRLRKNRPNPMLDAYKKWSQNKLPDGSTPLDPTKLPMQTVKPINSDVASFSSKVIMKKASSQSILEHMSSITSALSISSPSLGSLAEYAANMPEELKRKPSVELMTKISNLSQRLNETTSEDYLSCVDKIVEPIPVDGFESSEEIRMHQPVEPDDAADTIESNLELETTVVSKKQYSSHTEIHKDSSVIEQDLHQVVKLLEEMKVAADAGLSENDEQQEIRTQEVELEMEQIFINILKESESEDKMIDSNEVEKEMQQEEKGLQQPGNNFCSTSDDIDYVDDMQINQVSDSSLIKIGATVICSTTQCKAPPASPIDSSLLKVTPLIPIEPKEKPPKVKKSAEKKSTMGKASTVKKTRNLSPSQVSAVKRNANAATTSKLAGGRFEISHTIASSSKIKPAIRKTDTPRKLVSKEGTLKKFSISKPAPAITKEKNVATSKLAKPTNTIATRPRSLPAAKTTSNNSFPLYSSGSKDQSLSSKASTPELKKTPTKPRSSQSTKAKPKPIIRDTLSSVLRQTEANRRRHLFTTEPNDSDNILVNAYLFK